MIQKIRLRFIRIALMALSIAMMLVTLIINTANWAIVHTELLDTLDYLADSKEMTASSGMSMYQKNGRSRLGVVLSESRYFTAMISASGKLSLSDTTHNGDASSDELLVTATDALQSGSRSGFYAPYFYTTRARPSGVQITVFLNAETKLSSLRTLALISCAACFGGILLAGLLVIVISRRAIQPLVRSAVQQKQFITNAGHELKTPLTVISANMDVLKLDTGDNEWITSTQKQVANMRDLVNELVYLSRMDEDDAQLPKCSFDLSNALREAVEPYIAMAEFSGKTLTVELPDGLSMEGNESSLRRLAVILCDNAMKYAPDGDQISFRVRALGKKRIVETENGLNAPLSAQDLLHLFDRFYRVDASRSRENGGSGIGLAIARAITEKHAGTISAQCLDNGRLLIRCLLSERS